MKFSLIVPTIGRTEQLELLLNSLKEQTCQDFEIIISDQNTDDRVGELLKKIHWPEKITHIRSTGGASRARNSGLPIAKGEIITFPDDDCKYFPDLLERLAEFFDQHPEYGYLNGRSVADDGADAVSIQAKEAGDVQKFLIYQQCIEFAFFVRRRSLGDLQFDENLGTGSPTPWQSDEGPDLMLSLNECGVRGYYDPGFKVWHPRPVPKFDQAMVSRCYRYACGSGYFLRKHRYSFWYFAKLNGKTLGGAVLSLLTFRLAKARYYWARVAGRWRGWTGYDAENPSAAKVS